MHSSRGPISAEEVKRYCNYQSVDGNGGYIEAAGDAGFLLPFVFPELVRESPTKNGVCAVPHRNDQRRIRWNDMIPKENMLQVGLSWRDMALALQSCDRVISSSLHGVIVAESLGIPVRRIRVSKEPGDLKFDDFYLSYRGSQPKMVYTLAEANEAMMSPLPLYARDAYARRILKTFPSYLFQTEHILS